MDRDGMNTEQGVLIHEPHTGSADWYADDRQNVSALHRELQHRAIRWLANRTRCSCYASVEVPYKGFQCDALAVTRPNERFRKAVSGGTWWHTMVVLFEAKATQADFMASFGPHTKSSLKHGSPGNYRFLVKPRKVKMSVGLLPDNWGVLEASGRGLRIVKQATYSKLEDAEAHIDALFAILHYGSWGKRQLFVACPDCADEKETTK